MAGTLSRYGISLGALRRNFSSASAGNAHYVVYDTLLDEGKLPIEQSQGKIPEQDFPLPGKTVSSYHYRVSRLPRRKTGSWSESSDILTSASRDKSQINVLSHFLHRDLTAAPPVPALPLGDEAGMSTGERNLDDVVSGLSQDLEATAQEVPSVLRSEFSALFPGQPVKDWSSLSVLTLTQRTASDMSAWSPAMEDERDALTADFVAIATRVVAELELAGYWADFIDPTSGRPYRGPFTNATLFETDERYRHFGFRIEDLGCCKVVSHPLWGTNMFLGTVFTNAGVETEAVKNILARVSS